MRPVPGRALAEGWSAQADSSRPPCEPSRFHACTPAWPVVIARRTQQVSELARPQADHQADAHLRKAPTHDEEPTLAAWSPESNRAADSSPATGVYPGVSRGAFHPHWPGGTEVRSGHLQQHR